MPGKDALLLLWEWPADRSPQQKLLAVVETARLQDSGSIANSPSMADHLPDPVILTARTLGRDAAQSRAIQLRLPADELGDIRAGDTVAIGIVEEAICICIAKRPDDLDEAAAKAWLAAWSCD